jgi:hypothetical protein
VLCFCSTALRCVFVNGAALYFRSTCFDLTLLHSASP